ncbi:Rieske (2Fe-2S) protein [Halopiger xanaduensis]|uniref:Rieske (2Fe-2S) iron-sulfur domain protein n=1 Tax=Halopiger xanaduensis (strain DSM 18323 / JCM 14033 / SH-6) TaxID=797210 RepID=F8D3S8_HALXS|nr:Rieske 2Fe-2S domain-containing protein [Halopiger xanaduensis]AEH38581.1 Rieske (2Fe-2S) iron-sulfur domain protein [Halopiger xanaduensis SH-6]
MDAESRIVALADVPTDSSYLFRVADEAGDRKEAILVADEVGEIDETGETDDGEADDAGAASVSCWLNYCQHFTHIKLDKGSGAAMRNGEIVCENHGAYFEADSGYCTYGPCEGATLTELEVTVADGAVYLTDEEYAFVGPGPIEDDDDLTSTSNVEF